MCSISGIGSADSDLFEIVRKWEQDKISQYIARYRERSEDNLFRILSKGYTAILKRPVGATAK